jgi:GntR family transcriptional regulator
VVAVLGINPNTVVKAYRELEARHLVDTRQGRGSFVADLATGCRSIPPSLACELADWIERAKTSGLTRSDIAALADEKLHAAFPGAGHRHPRGRLPPGPAPAHLTGRQS